MSPAPITADRIKDKEEYDIELTVIDVFGDPIDRQNVAIYVIQQNSKSRRLGTGMSRLDGTIAWRRLELLSLDESLKVVFYSRAGQEQSCNVYAFKNLELESRKIQLTAVLRGSDEKSLSQSLLNEWYF